MNLLLSILLACGAPLAHAAPGLTIYNQNFALDLDDGVNVNYAKLGPVVAEAEKICGTKQG
jgi:hypothetical protein